MGPVVLCQVENQEIPPKLQNHYYNVGYPRLSPDSRYVVFNKMYEQNKDTIALIDIRAPETIIKQVPNAINQSVCFTKSGNLFYLSNGNAELMHLPSAKNIQWKNVLNGIYIKQINRIAILQGESLFITDEFGHVINTISSVINIKEEGDQLYYICENNNKYELYNYGNQGNILLMSSVNNNLSAKKISSTSYIIFERAGVNYNIYFKDISTQLFAALDHNFKYGIHSFMQMPIEINKNSIFMNLVINTKPRDKNEVELWYGNDNEIEKKTYGDTENKIICWNPVNGEIIEMQDKERTHLAYVGNSRFLLSFDPLKHKDFVNEAFPYTLFRYDVFLKKHEFLAKTGGVIYSDPTGKFLITPHEKNWMLINIETREKTIIPVNSSKMVYFSENGTSVIFENEEMFNKYDIIRNKLIQIPLPTGFRSKIINGRYSVLSPGLRMYKTSYGNNKDPLLQLWNKYNNKTAIALFSGNDLKIIIEPTEDYISSFSQQNGKSIFLYTLANINMPPKLIIKRNNQKEIIYSSNNKDKDAQKIKFDWVTSYNEKGVELRGILIYPLNYVKTQKYPMVVSVYESQRFESNQYLMDGMFGTTEGINSRYLIENGYFVFLPEIVYDERGTGISALDCVHSSLDALKSNKMIDFSRIALVGHSHGGYETNFIATQSCRFATYISGAGNSDLVRSYHSFNYQWSGPFFWQFENGQYRMPGSFAEYKDLYIKNSPVYYAEQVDKPILLWTGKEDQNIYWEQTMEYYLALRRNKKKVIALFYPNDGHSLQKTVNRVDLYTRIYDWLDFYLKDKKQDWIEKMYH